jgi:hypothetical protein
MSYVMSRNFLPNNQGELLLWSSAFSAGINAMGESIGIDPQQPRITRSSTRSMPRRCQRRWRRIRARAVP